MDQHTLYVLLLSGCCTISGFGSHLGLADHSPWFDTRASSPWSSQLQLRDQTRFTNLWLHVHVVWSEDIPLSKQKACYVGEVGIFGNLLRLSITCRPWSSKFNQPLGFSLPSITVADLSENKNVLLNGVKRSFPALWLADLDPLCRFLYFCGQSVVAVIMIDSSKKCNSLVGVEVQSLYVIERHSKQQRQLNIVSIGLTSKNNHSPRVSLQSSAKQCEWPNSWFCGEVDTLFVFSFLTWTPLPQIWFLNRGPARGGPVSLVRILKCPVSVFYQCSRRCRKLDENGLSLSEF